MRTNREMYGWSEVGNSDAHTLDAIGRGCRWFEGSTAEEVRNTIESGECAPGGKLWHVHEYLHLMSHRMNKHRRDRRERVA